MKEIKKYMALDGTVWDTKRECLTHEMKDIEQMYGWAQKIKAFCENMDNCNGCPFCSNDDDYDTCPCCLGVARMHDNFIPQNWYIKDLVDEFESDE